MNARIWGWMIVLSVFALSLGRSAERERPWLEDIEVDAQGNLFVLDNGNDEVLKLDKEGKLVWRAPLALENGGKSNSYRLRLAQRPPDYLYVLSTRAGVRDISPGGKVTSVFPPPTSQADGIHGVDAMGRVYYLDRKLHQVKRYREATTAVAEPKPKDESNAAHPPANEPKLSDGSPDLPTLVIDGKVEGPGHFGDPYNVIVDGLGNIWILDQSYVFRVFDSSGRFLREVKAPDPNNRSFTYVHDIETDSQGCTYVGCQETHSVLKYDKDGKLVKAIPTDTRASRAFGLDREGRIYIGDYPHKGAEIKVLDQSGQLLRTIMVE